MKGSFIGYLTEVGALKRRAAAVADQVCNNLLIYSCFTCTAAAVMSLLSYHMKKTSWLGCTTALSIVLTDRRSV